MVQGVLIQNGVIQNINPTTGELITPSVPVTTPSELAEVIATANTIQRNAWGILPLAERIALLRKGIAAIETIAEELRDTITKEMGKISAEAKLEVDNAMALKGAWLDMVMEANEDVRLGGGEDGKPESVIVRDPLGVVVVISPWNVSTMLNLILLTKADACPHVIALSFSLFHHISSLQEKFLSWLSPPLPPEMQ